MKLTYLEAAWEDKYIKMGMDRFKEQVSGLFYLIPYLHSPLSVSCLQGSVQSLAENGIISK